MYSFLHVLLLVAATLGIWVLRSRIFVAFVCFLIFPLPAALFHLYVVPNPVKSLVEPLHTSTGDCVRPPNAASATASRPAGDDAGETATREGDPRSTCAPAPDSSGKWIFFAVVLVHYLTVSIGLFAGWLAKERATPKPVEVRDEAPRRERRGARRRSA